MAHQKILRVYQTKNSKEPFTTWLRSIKDATIRARIRRRLERLEQGQYGDTRALGKGVYELRFFFGAGYRVYFAEDGNTIFLLLCGGDKSSQTSTVRLKFTHSVFVIARSGATRQSCL